MISTKPASSIRSTRNFSGAPKRGEIDTDVRILAAPSHALDAAANAAETKA